MIMIQYDSINQLIVYKSLKKINFNIFKNQVLYLSWYTESIFQRYSTSI